MLTLGYICDVRLTIQFDDFHYPVMFDVYSKDKIIYKRNFSKERKIPCYQLANLVDNRIHHNKL